jgi:hypothetical protein
MRRMRASVQHAAINSPPSNAALKILKLFASICTILSFHHFDESVHTPVLFACHNAAATSATATLT